MEFFLSHTSADKEIVRTLGVQLQLAGADVFFDEWDVQAGESISGAIDQALMRFDVFLLVWSHAASKSLWVRREYRSGVKKFIEEGKRLICVRLDEAPVPALIDDLKWIAVRGLGDVGEAVDNILGLGGSAARLRAIQEHLQLSGIEVDYHVGYGPIVGCPRCGAGLEHITGWEAVDPRRDDVYAGARCRRCGWNDGGEI